MKHFKFLSKGLDQIHHALMIEWDSIFKDRGALLILLIAVWVYPLVYSIAYQSNVIRNIPMTVVDRDNTALSRQLIRMVGATQEMEVKQETGDFKEAEELFGDGDSKGIILIPADFEKNLLKGGQAHIGLYCDANFFLIYKESLRGTLRAAGTLSAGVEIKRLIAAGTTPELAKMQRDPVTLRSYTLYNPAGSYGSYLMPGLILVIIQQTLLVGIGMIGGARREKQKLLAISQNHELSAIFFTLTGRSLAYFLLYSFNLIFTQIVLSHWFGFPDKGSVFDLWILMVPFLFSVIFMGLTVSLLLSRREHSIMMLVFLSPVVLFVSGMSWPASSLPPMLYRLAHVFPSTSVIPAYLRISSMGATLKDVRSELLFLIGQMFVYGALAMLNYRIYLHRKNVTQIS
ncbi:MAG: ABC transporter permease [Prolixibacteraceae bacterium]